MIVLCVRLADAQTPTAAGAAAGRRPRIAARATSAVGRSAALAMTLLELCRGKI